MISENTLRIHVEVMAGSIEGCIHTAVLALESSHNRLTYIYICVCYGVFLVLRGSDRLLEEHTTLTPAAVLMNEISDLLYF